MPVGAKSFSTEGIRQVCEVFHNLKKVLKKAGHNTNVGDEGGFAPSCDNEEALKYIMEAIDKAGYKAGRDADFAIALDCASSELFDEGDKKGYKFWKSNPDKLFSAEEMVGIYKDWCDKYPIISIEDALDQDDWDGYVSLTKELGDKRPAGRRRLLRHQPEALRRRHREGRLQQHPDQGQPDRHPVRDPRRHRAGQAPRLHLRAVAPLR